MQRNVICGNMTNKELYSIFCQNTPDLPIFMQGWWMDSVCAGKQWDVLLYQDSKGEICAVMPYLLRKRRFLCYVLMPQMTQIGGIWINENIKDDANLLTNICKDFSQKLAEMNLCYYYQQYPLSSPIPAIMQTLGFKIKERVTYRIEDLSNLDKVINAFSKNKKRQLQKALSLHADRDINVEDFYRFHVQCLQERSRKISYTREFLLVLDRKTQRLNQRQILGIRNADGELLAAAFLVWDKNNMYYLIPCYRESYKNSGASALLVLEAIKIAREKGVAFDFEGSIIRGIANHYKQFGSQATTYYSVEKYYRWWFRLGLLWNKMRER